MYGIDMYNPGLEEKINSNGHVAITGMLTIVYFGQANERI